MERLIHLPISNELKKEFGGQSITYRFLQRLSLDCLEKCYDFCGDTMPGDATAPGTLEIKQNASGTATILADQLNGVCQIDTVGTTANDYCFLSVPELPCKGDLYSVVAVRLSGVSTVANTKIEVGFSDATTNAGIVNALATPTFNATDGVCWIYDTNDTAYWQMAGVKDGSAATKIEPELHAPAAGTYQTLVIALEGTFAKFYLLNADHELLYESTLMDAVTASTQLSPWVGVQTRAAAARKINVDYIAFWQYRDT
ncbi:MAG: hypothetical protein JRD89_03665 [Deltaproteobacteria bacterium]|nr:hypothetical protein [Deltaproteobacteria bacterium]